MTNFTNLRREETIRRQNVRRKIVDLMKVNPNKSYALIRVDEDYDPNGTNLDTYLDSGWDVVHDDQPVVDYRSDAPDNANETALRKHPILKAGKGKSEFMVVCKDKDKIQEDEKARAKRTLERYIASSTGRKIEKEGNKIKMTDSEVNESNMNNNLEV